ncbi:MAG: UDP-2,3-diacylglucosamine diphosphatase LpxI [Alphaproteobacteria bacterium]|nr:UDP-2,3-diacylglucosamine diphosphatase LpxI [Alphaproteobacteria bacterium]
MPAKLGIVAGGGTLPARLIEACRARGRPFHVLAFRDHADPVLLAEAPADWIRLGEAGGVVELLRRAGVSEVVMAGPIRRPSLAELRPDWRTVRLVARLGAHSIGDDGLLRAVVREFEIEGFRVIGINDVLDDLVATIGPYGRIEPDEQGWDDIRRGFSVARALGAVDVGQAVVVQQGIVLGVEAIEGTDALMARCAALKREGPGGVLVKLPKPGQERRADLPTVGVATLRNAAAAGLRGIAVEAGGTLVVGRDEVAAAADELGLFVIGVAP